MSVYCVHSREVGRLQSESAYLPARNTIYTQIRSAATSPMDIITTFNLFFTYNFS